MTTNEDPMTESRLAQIRRIAASRPPLLGIDSVFRQRDELLAEVDRLRARLAELEGADR